MIKLNLKQIFLFGIYFLNSNNLCSQSLQQKVDSLQELQKVSINNIEIQLYKLDSLKNLQFNGQKVIDNIANDIDSLKDVQNYYIALIETDSRAKVEQKTIRTGYYYHKTIYDDYSQESISYNEIEWIYVSEKMEVRKFVSANYEHCMLNQNLKKKPKQIYRQIKKDFNNFNKQYVECNGSENYIPSKSYNEGYIVITHKNEKNINFFEVIQFDEKGLILKMKNNKGEIELTNYKFIGK